MNYTLRVRLLFCCSLIFSFGATSCGAGEEAGIELAYVDNRAKAILVPMAMLDAASYDAVEKDLVVTIAEPGSPPIIGDYDRSSEGYIVFRPAIPFTKGKKYLVLYKGRTLEKIEITLPPDKKRPVITAIYPSSDSLPENLLKIYINFSEQMQEGVSAEHIFLVKDGKDTLSDVFLDLQPELWNADRTMLTLWLNPGRIKRDLIPNKEEGPPLIAGAHYQILVKPGWHDAFGDSSTTAYQKNFIATIRDTLSPDMANWTISTPRPGTRDSLVIHFKEPLTYPLAKYAISVIDDMVIKQPGTIELLDHESTWRFTPQMKWRKDRYKIAVEPRVEDLAGNNLDRVFDKDLSKPDAKPQPAKAAKVYYKEFEIH